MGRLITNNLQNSGYYNVVKRAFADFNIDLNKVEDAEADTGLVTVVLVDLLHVS